MKNRFPSTNNETGHDFLKQSSKSQRFDWGLGARETLCVDEGAFVFFNSRRLSGKNKKNRFQMIQPRPLIGFLRNNSFSSFIICV